MIALFQIFLAGAMGCLWYSDTLMEELQMVEGASDVFHLITGQFPHHGKGYYKHLLKRSQERLQQYPLDLASRNDMAVALLKLGRYEESEKEFQTIDTQSPGLYTTLSNLGVLYKKKGNYEKAAALTRRALQINPEGHLGLGDYYLKMLTWMAEVSKNPHEPPKRNFWGGDYGHPVRGDEPPPPGAPDFSIERLHALIRSDRTFSDAFLVLGDVLYRNEFLPHGREEGLPYSPLNLALWAYVRAKQLNHPNQAVIDGRIKMLFNHWWEGITQLTQGHVRIVRDRNVTIAQIQSDLVEADRWLNQFEKTEEKLIARKGSADFAQVEAEMTRKGIKRFLPLNRGILNLGSHDTKFWKSFVDEHLKPDSPELFSAIEIAGAIHYRKTENRLIQLLSEPEHPHEDVRIAAVRALGKVAGRKGTSLLLHSLGTGHDSHDEYQVITALCEIRSDLARKGLVTFLLIQWPEDIKKVAGNQVLLYALRAAIATWEAGQVMELKPMVLSWLGYVERDIEHIFYDRRVRDAIEDTAKLGAVEAVPVLYRIVMESKDTSDQERVVVAALSALEKLTGFKAPPTNYYFWSNFISHSRDHLKKWWEETGKAKYDQSE